MISFKNLGVGGYAAIGPKGRTDRFIVVKYASGTFDVLDVNANNRSVIAQMIEAGDACRTPHGQDASMAVIGSRSFNLVGTHHFGRLRTIEDHISHMAAATNRPEDRDLKDAAAFFAAIRAAVGTQS